MLPLISLIPAENLQKRLLPASAVAHQRRQTTRERYSAHVPTSHRLPINNEGQALLSAGHQRTKSTQGSYAWQSLENQNVRDSQSYHSNGSPLAVENSFQSVSVVTKPVELLGAHRIEVKVLDGNTDHTLRHEAISFREIFARNFGHNNPTRLKTRFKHLLFGKEYCKKLEDLDGAVLRKGHDEFNNFQILLYTAIWDRLVQQAECQYR